MSASCQAAKPSSSALQLALQSVLRDAHPPPLLPHPPQKSMTWRTRRIVAELNAQKDVDSLAAFETELRGVLRSQEMRCRTRAMAAALGEECALREREALAAAEAAQRCALAESCFAVAQERFAVVHLFMLEEVSRRALRQRERSARRQHTLLARGSRCMMEEAAGRDALGALEACGREELQCRRVVEMGNEVQREIVTKSRLSVHLRSVARSQSVQQACRLVAQQEDGDRTALERLQELHLLLLLQDAKEDFTAALRKDVVVLSQAKRERAQQQSCEMCAEQLEECVASEARLRGVVEEHEAGEFKTMAQGFLLGWRSVYKAITRDSDVVSVFGKIELLVRREIAEQQRRELAGLRAAMQSRESLLLHQRAARRAVCQEYVQGARAIWVEENSSANALLRLYYRHRAEAEALQVTTVLSTAEAASRRGVLGAEALARLHLKLAHVSAALQHACTAGAALIGAEEESSRRRLHLRFAVDVYTQQEAALVSAESAARAVVERDEATAAADVFVGAWQALQRSRVCGVAQALDVVEGGMRMRLEREEESQRGWLALRCCRFVEQASRWQVAAAEVAARSAARVAALHAVEEVRRAALSTAAMAQLASLHAEAEAAAAARADVERAAAEGDGDATTDASLRLSGEWDLPQCMGRWSEVCAAWEVDGDTDTSTASFATRKVSGPPVLDAFAQECEAVLTDAFMERDLVHFEEHAARRCLARQLCAAAAGQSTAIEPGRWQLRSLSVKQEPNQRAASVNMWDSNQTFDVTFPLSQQQEEGIVGERTIAFYVPYVTSTAATLRRDAAEGMVFFLVLDEDGTVMASATVVVEPASEDAACLCIALDNSAGYLRFD